MIEPAGYLIDDGDVPALREAVANIASTGYTETAVRERLGLRDVADLQWRAVPIYRERLDRRDPLTLAIELFLFQGSLSTDELDRLLVASSRDVLRRTGLLSVDETGLARARVALFPVADRLVFSDHAWPELALPGQAAVPYDQVMFVGRDSCDLARCTVRRPVRAALDLCTGSGIHALLASTHAERVLAVDINSRAARCTRFNAQAWGAANLEVVVGDLFEPIRGERFDLITANPPFVPSPVDALGFRDGGRSGEDIQKRIVAGLPHHLAPGGIAQMVTELGERDNEPIVDRLRQWLGGAPIDIHVLRLREHSAMNYAIGHATGGDFGAFLESVGAWSANLRTQGYQRVIALLVSFAWSDPACGPAWEHVDAAQPPLRPAGAEIEAAFTAERMTRRRDLRQLLSGSWLRRPGPIALLDARVLGSEIRAEAKATLLRQALTIEHQVDPIERAVLNCLDGRVAVSELIVICRQLKFDEDSVFAAICSLLRRRLVCIDAPAGRAPSS